MRSRWDQPESAVIADTAAFMPPMVPAAAVDEYAPAGAIHRGLTFYSNESHASFGEAKQ